MFYRQLEPYDAEEFKRLENLALQMLGEYLVRVHVGPFLVPCSSDCPEEEATIQVRRDCPSSIDGKNLYDILQELRDLVPAIYIWDILPI